MKKLICAVLVLCLSIAFCLPTLADENEDILTSQNYTTEEKLAYLEAKYDVKLVLDSSVDSYITQEELVDLDCFLGELTTMNTDQQERNLLQSIRQIASTRSDGTFSGTWDEAVDEKVVSPDGRYSFTAKGTLRFSYTYTKTTINNKVYVSGTVTNCRFLAGASYSGTMSFVGGSLNIQGSGTACAIINPEADTSFEVVYGLLTVIFEHTFVSTLYAFIIPS